jgi:hypothetical protein
MVATISSLVKVAPRQWLISWTGFSVATVGSAASVGGVLGAMSPWRIDGPTLINSLAIAALAVLAAAVDSGLVPLAYPRSGSSVPQGWWRDFGPTKGALAYGAVLGLGISTFVPVISFYWLLMVAFLGGLKVGLAVGVSYGIGRAAPVAVGSVAVLAGMSVGRVSGWPLGAAKPILRQLVGWTVGVSGVALGAVVVVCR